MSQDRRVGGGYGGRQEAGGGSVRRARELLEAGVRRELPADSIQAPSPNKSKRQPQKGIGVAISNPVPTTQWQQRDESKPAVASTSITPKGPPPARPKRPSFVPSILDSSKIQDITPSISYRPQKDPAASSNQERPSLPSSGKKKSSSGRDDRPSAGSEGLTDISESVSGAPTAPRRSANLGPPPTSRRGPSSYYSSNGPFVSPIPEEFSDHTPKKESYASSAAIPLSWGTDPRESDILGVYDDESTSDSRSDGSNNGEDETTLVRQASMGKRARPALRTISKESQPGQSEPRLDEEIGLALTIDEDFAGATSASKPYQRNEPRGDGWGYSTLDLDGRTSSASDSSDSSGFYLEKAPIILDDSAPVPSDAQRRDGGIASTVPGMSSKFPESRRPPPLNVDAVRAAEARGSLSSLSDLIRRATALASNLDRGVTASRLGFFDMFNGSRSPNQEQKFSSSDETRASRSISRILASFPPPRNDTPNDLWPHRPAESIRTRDLQSRQATIQRPGSPPPQARRRRCCRMPLRIFICLCIVAFLVIAAAIVVPVVLLVVVPRNRHPVAGKSSSPGDTNPCQQTLPCMNGGVSVNNDNKCACVCVNGFSGSQCTVSGDASCTTAAIGDGSSIDGNATVGSALPRLFNEAGANYSIPLNQTDILSLFSANNLTCTTQNALVTFDGSSQKRRRGLLSSDPSTIEDGGPAPKPHITPTPIPAALLLGARDDPNINSIATSNGILYDPEGETLTSTSTTSAGQIHSMMMGGPLQQATTTPTSALRSTSNPSPSPSPSPSSSSLLTTRVLDFARIAVLFILDQTDDLDEAATAQSGIASFLNGMSAAAASSSSQNATSMDMNMSMNMTSPGGGSVSKTPTDIVLNFANFTISFPNGTVVGGGKG